MFYLYQKNTGKIIDKSNSNFPVCDELEWIESDTDFQTHVSYYDGTNILSYDPALSINDLKSQKKSELKTYYESMISREVTFNNYKVIANRDSIYGVIECITRLDENGSTTLTWYFDDGNVSDLDRTDYKNLLIALKDKDMHLRANKKTHEDAIDGETSKEAVANYDFTTGW